MHELILPAGRWWDQDGRLSDRELVLTIFGPRLATSRPGYLVVTGTVAGSDELIWAEVDRRELPPEKPGPEREDAEPGTAYRCGDPVWVWSTVCRCWCAGTVDAASRIALQVTYTLAGQRGTVADAVPPCYVARRNPAEDGDHAKHQEPQHEQHP